MLLVRNIRAHQLFARCHRQILRFPRFLTVSAVEGSSSPPLETKTLADYFRDDILEKHSGGGTRPALICRNEKPRAHGGPESSNLGTASHLAWDYDEFQRHILSLARGLLGMGVRPGDRVAVIMGNNSAYAMLQWACTNVGAILVTINPAYRVNELVDALRLAEVNHMFIVPRIRTSSYLDMISEALPDLRNSKPGNIEEPKLPQLRNLVVVDNTGATFKQSDVRPMIDWREILIWSEHNSENKTLATIRPTLNKDDVINMQFTSGTTGFPKAVSLTHYNLLNNGLFIGRAMNFSNQDILCNLAAFTHGACVVYPSEIFNPSSIVDAVTEEKCTALHGVPTHFLGVLAEVANRKRLGDKLDFSQLRTGIAAGSPIPIELMKKLIDQLNLVDLTIAYGMTETSPVTFQTTPADSLARRTDTVGKVSPHVKAKIVDSDGKVVPVGKPGELWVAGYPLQKGYWNDEAQTKSVMQRDESGVVWMHTGDEGIMDEDGYLQIVGRIKDIIIRGGENLFPAQIENALTSHPDIREAAAVSVPDSIYGEVVGAWVALQPDTKMSREEVRAAVSRSMNPQNAPAWVWFVNAEEIPKTASGKVQKHILREWSKEHARRNEGKVESPQKV